jgi:hypothetical protein
MVVWAVPEIDPTVWVESTSASLNRAWPKSSRSIQAWNGTLSVPVADSSTFQFPSGSWLVRRSDGKRGTSISQSSSLTSSRSMPASVAPELY